jgi:hypothetical protein
LKRLAISFLALGACSTMPPPPRGDVDLTHAGLIFAIEICHRNVIDGVPVAQAVCTVDGMPEGKSASVLMTSRLDSEVTNKRAFAATVMQADAASCTAQQIP